MLKNILKNSSRLTLFLYLFLPLLFFLIGYTLKKDHVDSNFKIQLKDLKYKFPQQNATVNTELIQYQERMNQLNNPSDIDYATLAELYVAEAKRNGTSTNYDLAEKLAETGGNISNGL